MRGQDRNLANRDTIKGIYCKAFQLCSIVVVFFFFSVIFFVVVEMKLTDNSNSVYV